MNYSLLVLLFFFNVNLYSQHYAIKSVELGDIEINCDFDSKVNYGLISNYKSDVDAVMSHILGKSADYMDASRPESLLSNWVADVMLNTAVGLGWNVDFDLCNIGGLRSYMPKGHIVKWGKMHVLSALSV